MNYTSMCLVLITVKSCGPIIKFKTNYLIKKNLCINYRQYKCDLKYLYFNGIFVDSDKDVV